MLYLLCEKQQQGHVLIIWGYFSKWHGSLLSQSLICFISYVILWYFTILIASYMLRFQVLHHLSWAFLSYGMLTLVVRLTDLDISKDCSAFIFKELSSFRMAGCEPPPHSITSQKIRIIVSCYLYCKLMSHWVVIFAAKWTDIKPFYDWLILFTFNASIG